MGDVTALLGKAASMLILLYDCNSSVVPSDFDRLVWVYRLIQTALSGYRLIQNALYRDTALIRPPCIGIPPYSYRLISGYRLIQTALSGDPCLYGAIVCLTRVLLVGRSPPFHASRLVQKMPAGLVQTRHAPSRHCRDARVHTAMHAIEHPPPRPRHSSPLRVRKQIEKCTNYFPHCAAEVIYSSLTISKLVWTARELLVWLLARGLYFSSLFSNAPPPGLLSCLRHSRASKSTAYRSVPLPASPAQTYQTKYRLHDS